MNNQSALMVAGGGAALAIGAFLAWGRVSGSSYSGIEAVDGWVTFVGGTVVTIYGLIALRGESKLPKWLAWEALGFGLGVALINLWDIFDVGSTIGVGMWLILVGGLLAIVGLSRPATI